MDQFSVVLEDEQEKEYKKLYLKLSSETGVDYRRVRPVLNMFIGKCPVFLYFSDSGVRRQTHCVLDPDLLAELREILGKENVVVK